MDDQSRQEITRRRIQAKLVVTSVSGARAQVGAQSVRSKIVSGSAFYSADVGKAKRRPSPSAAARSRSSKK